MFAVLAGSTFTFRASANPPRKPRPSEERRMKIVQSLLATQQAKQRILKRVKYQTLAQQKQIASELAKIVADPESHRNRPESVKAAMSLLGELRAKEGADVLANHIGFPFIYHPEAGRPPLFGVGSVGSISILEESLPAIPALVSIGEPCIDVVIAKLSKTERVLEQNACIRVLTMLDQGPTIRKKLKTAFTKAPPRRRFVLRIALNALHERPIYSKPVRLLLPKNRKMQLTSPGLGDVSAKPASDCSLAFWSQRSSARLRPAREPTRRKSRRGMPSQNRGSMAGPCVLEEWNATHRAHHISKPACHEA